jgi:hypothetical protein
MDGRANPLMDLKVVVIFGVVAVATSPTTAGCSEVQCICSYSYSVVVDCSVVVVAVIV